MIQYIEEHLVLTFITYLKSYVISFLFILILFRIFSIFVNNCSKFQHKDLLEMLTDLSINQDLSHSIFSGESAKKKKKVSNFFLIYFTALIIRAVGWFNYTLEAVLVNKMYFFLSHFYYDCSFI